MTEGIEIKLHYGDKSLPVSFPSSASVEVLTPRQMAPISDFERQVRQSLLHPVGCPALHKMLRREDRILILSDDNTRLTPVRKILPPLFEELARAGIEDSQVRILFALGTHRPMTDEEILHKIGSEFHARVPASNHIYNDESCLVDMGTTGNGTPVTVNRLVMEADFVIGIGSIVPHHIAGFSGGSKIVQPGICGALTTAHTHLLSTRAQETLLGKLNNPVRRELDMIANRIGMRFIINTVLNANGDPVGVVAGDTRQAFQKGTGIAVDIYGVAHRRKADIVISNSHPCEIDFWQAHKSLYPAEKIVKNGGVIIVVTPCPEGVSSQHPVLLKIAGHTAEEIEDMYMKGSITQGVPAALAIAWAKVRAKARIIMVSDGIPADHQHRLGFYPAASVQEALERAVQYTGPDPAVAVLTHAPDTLPVMLNEDIRTGCRT
jgi:lactate racemase